MGKKAAAKRKAIQQPRPAYRAVGLMGGTFDPVHEGHVQCAQAVMDAMGLEKIIFLPAGVPVYKLDQTVTPAQDRVAMLKLALAGHEGFEIDTCEIDRDGKTYTSDTLRQLRKTLPWGTDLVFIAGADAALTIPQWKESAVIAEEAQIAAVMRPGTQVDRTSAAYQRLQQEFVVIWIDVATQDVSSSQIRAKVSQGQSIEGLVCPDVAAYIQEKGLYMLESQGERASEQVMEEAPTRADAKEEAKAVDPLSKEFYQAMKEQMRTRVNERRFQHVVGVAKTAKKIAKVYGVDPRKARLAGILHDWDKNFDDHGIRRRAEEVGLEVDPLVRDCMAQTLHGMTASRALARDYPCIPDDVLQAVDRHTTAAVGMEDLDMVVFIADCLEPSRRFGRCDELRALIGQVPLEELFFQVHGYWITLIIGRGRTMHPSTVDTWNYYALRHVARKEQERQQAGLPPKQIDPCAVSEK